MVEIIDRYDKRILEILQRNARTSYTALAKQIKMSRNAVKYRINILEECGLIKGYRVHVDHQKIDLSSVMIITIRTEPSNVEECVRELEGRDEVFEIFHLAGQAPIFIKVFFRNVKHQNSFLTETLEKMKIKEYSIHPVQKVIKEESVPITIDHEG